MADKKIPPKKRYIIITLAVMILFGYYSISWFRHASFEENGQIVNAIFIVLVTLVVPLILLIAAFKGKLQTPKEQFMAQGFIASTTLSRSKPGLLPTLLVMSIMILIGSVAIAALMELAASWRQTGEFSLWALLGLFPFFLYLYIFFYLLARFWVNRRIARIMAGVSLDKPTIDSQPAAIEIEPPGDCELISELPKKTKHLQRLTGGKNTRERHALRVLYLWNFDVGYPNREIKSWRRYGPVYWLWSPNNVPASRYLSLALGSDPGDFFASDTSSVKQWIHKSDESPKTGFLCRRRYPEHSITCVADIWQDAVSMACKHADAVVLDARSFTRERSGLMWELNHVIKHVPVDQFLIIADLTTDLRELVSVIHSTAGNEANGPLARIVYPPLPGNKEEIARLFDKAKVPSLPYEADHLVHLFAGE